MRLGKGALVFIAEMICGNERFDFCPYRTASNLTLFFANLDLDYIHDGSTRNQMDV